MSYDPKQLKDIIEAVVREVLDVQAAEAGKADPGFVKKTDPSGIIAIRTATVKTEPFGDAKGVRLKDVTTLAEAPRIGCGVMELEIEIDGRVVKGGPGDIIYIPKDSHIHFQTPTFARYVYVVYPANWQN